MVPLKCVLINAIKLILMHLLFNKMIHLYVRVENRTSGLLLVKYKQTACKASTKMNRYLFIRIISITPCGTIVIIVIYEFSWIKAIIYVLNSHSLKSVEGHYSPFLLSSSLRSTCWHFLSKVTCTLVTFPALSEVHRPECNSRQALWQSHRKSVILAHTRTCHIQGA